MTSIAMSAAVTGAQAQQQRIDIIANNVANVNTDGYKKVEASFSDLFYINLKKAGMPEADGAAARPMGAQIGLGTKFVGTYRNMEIGPMRQTNHALDIALTGPGYFAIALPNNRVAYTRAGAFQRNKETGNMITADGYTFENNPIQPIPIEVDISTVHISDSGMVTIPNPDDPTQPTELGQLDIFTFPNENGLEAIGNNLLVATDASGESRPIEDEDKHGRFKQKWLEGSNVKAVEELVRLIEAQRAYELNTRVISTQDKIFESTNNIK